MLESLKNILKFAADYDAWSLISLIIIVIGSIAGYLKFFKTKRTIKNFIINFSYQRAEGWNFPLRILIVFTNHTGKNIHIASATFKLNGLRTDPKTHGDTYTGQIPLRFPREVQLENGQKESILQDFEYYLEVDKATSSYAPLDPKHTDEEIEEAFKHGKVGIFDCYVSLLSRDHKPIIHRLKIKPKSKSPQKSIV